MLSAGPKPQNHTERLALVHQLSERLQILYAGEVVAIALYGSVARLSVDSIGDERSRLERHTRYGHRLPDRCVLTCRDD